MVDYGWWQALGVLSEFLGKSIVPEYYELEIRRDSVAIQRGKISSRETVNPFGLP